MISQSEEEIVNTFGIRGFSEKCRCGIESTIYTLKTQNNTRRPFFRCPTKINGHLFKWVKQGVYEEVLDLKSKVGGIESDLSDFYKAKSEFVALKVVAEETKEEMMRTEMEIHRIKMLLKFCVGFICVITILIVWIVSSCGWKKLPHLVYGY